MADTRLYKVAITPCGKYVHGTEYDALSLVLNATEDGGDGCAYVSLKKNMNVRPGTDDTVWALSVEKGAKGDRGLPGSGFNDVEIEVDGISSSTPTATAEIVDEVLYLSFSGLKGAAGENGRDGQNGQDGSPGQAGAPGKSAYQIWLDAGNVGSESAFLASLKGNDGQNGQDGINGSDGKSAYQSAVDGGYQGTEQEWIASLHGADGQDGQDGQDGVGFDSVSTPQDGTIVITLTDGNTVTIDLNHNHPQYYSKVVETSIPSGGLLPDVVYNLGTLTGSVTFSLAAAVTGNVNHYFWMFDTGSTAPTVTWPSSNFAWADGTGPTITASKHYEISVLNGIATFLEV